MAALKTKAGDASVTAFINSISNEDQREDCFLLKKMMTEVTGEEAKMWGTSIVGFGSYHYKYESGHEGNSCKLGFAPRKQSTTLHLAPGMGDEARIRAIGKVKTGKGCLYIKRMSDIDQDALRRLMKYSLEMLEARYGKQ